MSQMTGMFGAKMYNLCRFRNSFSRFIFVLCLLFTQVALAATESVRVSANNDDAEERVSNGDMSRGSSDLELGHDGSVQQIVGMRFRSVNIPQGASINSAYIEFEVDETDSGTTNLVIYGEDEDSPNQFENNDDNISERTKTSASVDWTPSAWGSRNDLHQTSDIAAIIQEIVNRSGWSANNNMVIIIEAGTGCSSSTCQRTAESHNGASDEAPLLVVEYDVAGGSTLAGSLNVDNTFEAYISTDDSVQGTLLTSGTDWRTTETLSTNLIAGQEYYLHIYASDVGGVAGFLGDFEITGTDHTFSNGLTTLNTNTVNWTASTSGWSNYQTASAYGINGVVPWGTRSGVNASAEWIWSSNNDSHNENYFSTQIIVAESSSPPAISSVAGSCAALTAVTISFSEGLEQSSAETTSNYQILNPSGGVITINSATKSTADTVTLALASSLNDLTEYTVTINNVQDLDGDSIVAGSNAAFTLACGLNCISDSFAGPGGLSASWSASSSNGSFGVPRIVDNTRLRLTDDSGQVATVATLLNQFPGADNKIEIEFDYYAYDGSGADGIALTFSDASIPPVPGSYGGALGYAQRSGGNPGFAGGWLGIGIDEYGNFANNNEGKDGGSGFERDSVALRGSGSGTSGYKYLTSTGTLSPGIDQSGSTANPGHRYKISIDHTMGGDQAYVKVARDTGAGYVDIVPSFDVFAVNPSQDSVPENWVVSFTGSTGGSTNIHEISDLQVCAAQPIGTYGGPDHYEITHASSGITCESAQVTVTAHDASHDPFAVSENTAVDIVASPSVENIISSPVTILAGTSSATFDINQTTALSNIDFDVSDGSATDLDDGGAEDLRFNFVDTAFRFYANGSANAISNQVAGLSTSGQNLTLKAVKTDDASGACIAALTGTTSVDIAYECNNPTACTNSDLLDFSAVNTRTISRNNNAQASLSYASVDMAFDASGEAPFSFNFSDSGQVTLYAHKTVTANDPEPAFTLAGNSNAFVVRPFGFDLTLAGTDQYATDHTGTRYTTAGSDFGMQIRAVNWASADDADSDGVPDSGANLSDNSVTPNFGEESNASAVTLTHSLTAPSGGTSGILSSTSVEAGGSSSRFSSAVASATLSWDEVGIIDISATLEDYLGATAVDISGIASNVGRFYPARFDVSANSGSFSGACDTFSYIGQDFGYETVPSLTITAKNVVGATTQNYTDSHFMKLVSGDISRVFPLNDINEPGAEGSNLMDLSTNPLLGALSASGIAGVMTYLFDANDRYRYVQNSNALIAPFESELSIVTNDFQDVDGVTATSIPPITPTGTWVRYGRWNMSNAFGPETAHLEMPGQVEYLTDTGYELNAIDTCSVLSSSILSTNPAGSPGSGGINNIAVGGGESNFSCDSLLEGGDGSFSFSMPGAGYTGSIDLRLDLSSQSWLRHDWDTDGHFEDHPDVTASFGQYRSHDRIIYWREVGR